MQIIIYNRSAALREALVLVRDRSRQTGWNRQLRLLAADLVEEVLPHILAANPAEPRLAGIISGCRLYAVERIGRADLERIRERAREVCWYLKAHENFFGFGPAEQSASWVAVDATEPPEGNLLLGPGRWCVAAFQAALYCAGAARDENLIDRLCFLARSWLGP